MRIGVLASVGHMLDSFFLDIVASWQQAGHEVSLAAGTSPQGGGGTVIAGLTRRPGLGALRARSSLRDWAERERLDVVITNTATASALVRTARLQVPVVYFCHGLHWNEGRGPGDLLWQAAERLLLRRTAGVITINSDDESWFSRRLPEPRILRLACGVGLNPADYPPAPMPVAEADDGAGPELVWIGEFSPRKRPYRVLDVVESLRGSGLRASVTMLGQGALHEALREQVTRRGLQDLVSAPGPGDSAQAIARSHALLHTATWEGLPRVMLEALAVGRRSYAFDVKGGRDIPGSRLVDDGDAAALAATIADDWRSGRMTEPPAIDRDDLDLIHAANAILVFLEENIVPCSPRGGPFTAPPIGSQTP